MERALTRIVIAGGEISENNNIEYILEHYLTQHYDTTQISSFDEVIKSLDQTLPDCLIINHSNENKQEIYQFIEAVQNKCDTVAIVLLLAHESPQFISEALSRGVGSYLIKAALSAETLRLAIYDALLRINYNRNQRDKNAKRDYLPNQEQFNEILLHSITRAKQRQRLFATLMCEFNIPENLDTIKFCESLSHFVSLSVRQVDTIAMLAENKIGIILQDISKTFDSITVANRILKHIELFQYKETELNFKFSIGIAGFPLDGNTTNDIIQHANLALAVAKEHSENSCKNFCDVPHENINQSVAILDDLHHAIERNEFYLMYQPIFNLDTFEIIGLEALLRWDHAKFGCISPGDFIPYAEKNGLIIPIGDWVFASACKQFKLWEQNNINIGQVFINISSLQLRHHNFLPMVTQVLEKYKMDPCRIGIELSDIALIDSLDKGFETLSQLQAFGMKISIDDFGSGFSSLTYFENLPANSIKIDQTFISGIPDNPQDNAVVASVITLSKNFGVSVIAEGIENDHQLEFLQENGCSFGQGYLLSRPMLIEDVDDFIKSSRITSVA